MVSESLLSGAMVTDVKLAIMYSLLLLVPALLATGATGALLARPCSGRLGGAKQRRMRILAANGLLLMLPAAVFLYCKAARGEFDGGFYAMQALELAIGAVQPVLLALNFRDGLRLRVQRPPACAAEAFANRTAFRAP